MAFLSAFLQGFEEVEKLEKEGKRVTRFSVTDSHWQSFGTQQALLSRLIIPISLPFESLAEYYFCFL